MQRRPEEVDIPRIPVLQRPPEGLGVPAQAPAQAGVGGGSQAFPSDKRAPLGGPGLRPTPHVTLLGAGPWYPGL